MPAAETTTLRQALRDATSRQHDRLDRLVTAIDLTNPADYVRFLTMQYVARLPVETWLAGKVSDAPPPLTDLIADDLASLNASLPALKLSFTVPGHADPVGACWAIAGSSMGNRSMLRELTKSNAKGLPTTFLADGAMTTYWQKLKPALEAPAQDRAPAAAAAEAVFATFLVAAEACLPAGAAA